MSKKILIINGSYKKDGNTMTAIRWVQEGMNFKGAASEIINISSVKNRYSGCIGCRRCKISDEYKCFANDDAARIVLEMPNYDVVVFATPVYFGHFSAQMKSLIDRMYSHIKIINGEHVVNPLFKNLAIGLIATAGSDYPNGLSLLSKYMKELIAGFGNDLHQLLVPGCTVDPKDLKMRTEIREKAETFGQDLASRS
ncbi:NAD(P)H-dependent oxidoreductase [Desulfosporosinus sp. PR]|uniref:flavodoxin family protein n=1 Tax=Candidatus Desulfosporosinus nitrosoreducens TaxID=3401928 RepID=UPI0027F7A2E2|nr:NAD(P)H-dependent oxidoreductase [Desulfosporosinus sp. PR]MDQ7094021.1 NAD(P)H-dependent oxidoreductase [Desulfosporosinus sp. PR]